MRFSVISLSEFLTIPVYKSKNITRKNGDKLILIVCDKGICLVDSENGVGLDKYSK